MDKNNKESTEKRKIVLPVYLDTKIVLDMLCIMDDGLSMVKSITTSEASSDKDAINLDAKIGLKNVFSLLGFEASANAKGISNTNSSNSNVQTYDKVYTMTSLFSKLREKMYDTNNLSLIKNKEDFENINACDYVELKGDMEINPLIDLLDDSKELMKIAGMFSDEPDQRKTKSNKSNKNENQIIISQIEGIRKVLCGGNRFDIICNSNFGINAVIPVNGDYFVDSNKKELSQGTYTVLGKIIKKYSASEEISLFRNSSLAFLKYNMIKGIFNEKNMNGIVELTDKDISAEINGPAILIKPVAIYL